MRDSLQKCHVTVKKIIYHNKESGYSVFEGLRLRWSTRKKQYLPTKETSQFVGYLFCIFIGDHFELEVSEFYHETYGTQYAIIYSHRIEPATLIEIRTFIQKNVKSAKAQDILDRYGVDALNVLCKENAALGKELTNSKHFEELLSFLQLHFIEVHYAMPLYKQYQNDTVKILESNPYKPFFDDIFDFRTSDMLYLSLGQEANGPIRCTYAVLAAMQLDSASNGNVFLKREQLEALLSHMKIDASFSKDKISEAIKYLCDMNVLVNEGETLYLKTNYDDECSIAICLKKLLTEPKSVNYQAIDIRYFLDNYERDNHITFSAEQREAIVRAFISPVSIISGGPGTGKTQAINTIITALKMTTPTATIKVCAPTGKASVQISERSNVPSTTIHRMIGLNGFQPPLQNGALLCDFLIVDEFSMADINVTARLFDAVTPGARVIIVGDYNQLPSVGPGLVLRDFIASGAIPVTVLKQIFRQAVGSCIILNAHRIMNQIPGKSIYLKQSEDFRFIRAQNQKDILKIIMQSVNRDAQIISPVHKGDLGVDNLNLLLQNQLNPLCNQPFVECEDKEFRLGDKVIQTKNNRNLGVYNGECGYISEILYMTKKTLKVTYPNKEVWYSKTDLKELEMAYAITVHKTQGSEFPVVIMPVHESFGRALSKNLIYTALTRAKKTVILVGSKEALSEGLRRETAMERQSNLISRIRDLK